MIYHDLPSLTMVSVQSAASKNQRLRPVACPMCEEDWNPIDLHPTKNLRSNLCPRGFSESWDPAEKHHTYLDDDPTFLWVPLNSVESCPELWCSSQNVSTGDVS